MLIPLTDIADDTLPRDRTALDPDALAELQASIAASGLRTQIEVFPIEGDTPFALISGYRRLAAFRALNEANKSGDYAQIEATIRQPADLAAVLHAMVEENDIRADTSHWERAAIAVATHHQGFFDTIDAAIAALYPHARRQKRAKIRAIAEVVEALEGILKDPETLTERRLLRIGNVLRLGWGEIVETALEESRARTAPEQWQILAPILEEAETLVITGRSTAPQSPKRLSRPHPGVTIRRERTRHGFLFHVTGHKASSALTNEILEQIELMFSPA